MSGISYLRRGRALFLISALEYCVPFLRMLLLSRFLDLRELGFGSALLASYGLFEQVTDMALYRFVMTTKREEFDDALACAHGLSLIRGAAVCVLGFITAPLIAANFSLSDYWLDFALMGVFVMIRSFENFAPRIAEREFHFAAQFKTSLTANVLSLIVLVAALAATRDHRALMASLFVFMTCYAIASHVFSETPYRFTFRSPLFSRACRFSFPLMVNGVGLALSSQGDRFLVGSLLGLPALGIYSLISTVVILPTNMIWRLTGGVNTALFFNAIDAGKDMARRIALSGHVSALVGATYALGVALLLNIVVPIVFGKRFLVSQDAAIILAFLAYVRIVRAEPFGSLLLLKGRTKRLALVNLFVALGLLISAALMFYFPTIESAMAARFLGEFFGLLSVIYLTRNLLRGSLGKLGTAVLLGAAVVISVGCLVHFTSVGETISTSLAALFAYGLILAVWGGIVFGDSLRGHFSKWRLRES